MNRMALRMDDVGASSKRYEVYSTWSAGVGPFRVSGNWLFLKYLEPFKAWGPYRELDASDWRQICDVLETFHARLTVAITAAWAEDEQHLVPFPDKFPREAEAIRAGVQAGLLEVANHGLTHCVLEGRMFKPRWWSANRTYHREFWDWVPQPIQEDHIRRAQAILQDYFEAPVLTFVPPGNVFTHATLAIARRYGLQYLSCAADAGAADGMTYIDSRRVLAFHDRDLVLNGVDWLRSRLTAHRECDFVFVKDLGEG